MRVESLDKRAESRTGPLCRGCRYGYVVAALSSMETPPELQRGFAVPLAPCTLHGLRLQPGRRFYSHVIKQGLSVTVVTVVAPVGIHLLKASCYLAMRLSS